MTDYNGSTSPFTAFEGKYVGRSGNSLHLLVDKKIRLVTLGPVATFWRRENTTVDKFQIGDDVLIRLVKATGTTVRAWANLTRVRGTILSTIQGGYAIRLSTKSPTSSETELIITPDTESANMLSGIKMRGVPTLPNETYVDAIGLKLPTGIHATKVTYVLPGNPVSTPKDALALSQALPLLASSLCCSPTYQGHATWFDCGDGAGACETCNTSNDAQLAWPELASGCSGCTSTCCDCSSGCENQVSLSCGDYVTVDSPCNGVSQVCAIADCGPDQVSLCSYGCGGAPCGDDWSPPIVDLTKPTFAVFYDPSVYGCFGATAKVPSICNPCPS